MLIRQYLALFIFLVFVAQTFSSVFIVADYFVNTTSYVKNCENKAKPAMHCNGKCQMMKKIQQEENKDQQSAEHKYENKNEVLSSKSFFPSLPIVINCSANIYSRQNVSSVIYRSLDIFHPPQTCAVA